MLVLVLPFRVSAEYIFQRTQLIKLANGLQVVLLPDSSQQLVTVHIWIKTGVINETPDINGISHFIEHLLFKGTTTRPLNTIQQEIESKGGIINAATSKDFTFYHITIPAPYWSESLAILSDMAQNAVFNADELEKERLVILEEIKRQNDEPQAILWNKLNSAIFPPFPYQMTTLGTAESVNSLTGNTIRRYYHTYYRPHFMTVVMVGNFRKNEAIKKIKQLFPAKTDTSRKTVPKSEISALSKPAHLELAYQGEIVYHALGFPVPGVTHPDAYALDVAATILGYGRSSRLYSLLYEKEKLVFDVSAGFLSQKLQGLFFVSTHHAPEPTAQIENRIFAEIRRLGEEEISAEELAKAKRMLETAFILDNQTPDEKATTLGYYATVGDIKQAQTYLKNIQQVQREDIRRVVKNYLLKNHVAVVLTPAKGEK